MEVSDHTSGVGMTGGRERESGGVRSYVRCWYDR